MPLFWNRKKKIDEANVQQGMNIHDYIAETLMADMSARDRSLSTVYTDLSAKTLIAARDSVTTGELIHLDTIFRTMKQEWPRLRGNLKKLRGKVSRLEFEVMPYSEKDSKPTHEALEDARLVESAIYRARPKIGKWELPLDGLIRFLTESYDRGSGVVEILWEIDDIIYPRAYAPITPDFYRWSSGVNALDRLVLCPDGLGIGQETDFPQDKFIVAISNDGCDHPIFGANLVPLIGLFGAVKFGLQWFMTYCQLYGVPLRIGRANSEPARKKLLGFMKELGSKGMLALDNDGSSIEIKDNMRSGNSLPQKDLMEYAEKRCDILLLGNTLTTSTDSTGSRSMGETHKDTEEECVDDRADFVCEMLNNQLIPAIIRLNKGHLPKNLPYIVHKRPGSKRSLQTLEYVKGVSDIFNGKVAREWAHDVLEVPVPNADAELLNPYGMTSFQDEISAAAVEIKKKH